METTENYRRSYTEGFVAGNRFASLVGCVTLLGLSSILGIIYRINVEDAVRRERISASEFTARLCNYNGGNEMLKSTARFE
ncbi:MAG: hypothetical protein AABW89_05960 [Nanoarchaeota archaeon]